MFDFVKKSDDDGVVEIFNGREVEVVDVTDYDFTRDNKFLKLVLL